MGHTNSTANIALPQFIGTDKPTWLGDVNGAFSAIDSKVGTIDADISATDAKADNAVADAASAVATATSANTTAGNASTTATNALNIANNALTVATNADGHTNQLEMKVGLLADLHTTDKDSIVDAINEVKDAEGDLTTLTTSDKTSLVAAINEINQGGGGGSVSVNADGVKTYSQLLDDLYAAATISDINAKSKIGITSGTTQIICTITSIKPTEFSFASTDIGGGTPPAHTGTSRVIIKASSSIYDTFSSGYADYSSSVASVGESFTLYY